MNGFNGEGLVSFAYEKGLFLGWIDNPQVARFVTVFECYE